VWVALLFGLQHAGTGIFFVVYAAWLLRRFRAT
jgi:hypothetical protein